MSSKGTQCGDCRLWFSPEKLRERENPHQYNPVMSDIYINNKRCRFCWREEKQNSNDVRIQCPSCQRFYDKPQMKDKYQGYCGRCFESNANKIKCPTCGNLDIGETNICTKCQDASGNTEKLLEEITPLIIEKLYSNEPSKLYNVYSPKGWALTNARCPIEAYLKINSLNINSWIKHSIYDEFRNGPLYHNNDDRVENYVKALNTRLSVFNSEQYVKLAIIV